MRPDPASLNPLREDYAGLAGLPGGAVLMSESGNRADCIHGQKAHTAVSGNVAVRHADYAGVVPN